MSDGNAREIFLKIMNFEPCNRTIKWEFGYWEATLKRWYREGLPKSGSEYNIIGPGHPIGSPSWSGEIFKMESDVQDYFGFDDGWTAVPYDYWIFPKFKEKVFYEDDIYIEYSATNGIRQRTYKDNSSMPMFLEYPIKGRSDWEKFKEERFNVESIDKRFKGDEDKFIEWSKGRTKVLALFDDPIGFFGSLRQLIGEKNLFMLYYDDPELIRDILEHLCRLWISMAEELTSKFDFDIAVFWEDMAGKQGSLISPSIFREFMMQQYRKLIDFTKSKGIKLFNVDSDGDVNELIPLFVEAGITSMYPFEQQAGNDIVKIRKKYPELGIIGGIDKNIFIKGKKDIDKELEKASYLIKKGGYIPYIDHMVPPNSPWQDFKYYRNRLNKIIDSTTVLS